jgi:glycosyltransferase involved in cell wall biosynthesis
MIGGSIFMRVEADAGVFQSGPKIGGKERIYLELFPRMCKLNPNLEIVLWGSEPFVTPLPEHPHIHRHKLTSRNLRPGKVWKRIAPALDYGRLKLGVNRNAIWHAIYSMLPLPETRATIVNVYDTVMWRYPDHYGAAVAEQFRHFMDKFVPRADIILTISNVSACDIQEHWKIPADRIRIVGCAPSDSFRILKPAAYTLPLPTQRPFLLYVGTRRKYKNFQGFMEEYAKWSGKRDYDVIVAGNYAWADDELKLISELGIKDRIHLVVQASDDQLAELYNQASLFIHPSLWEGFGIPLLEALACGCPLVASRIPTSLEIAADLPVYFDPEIPGSLHQALDTALARGRTPEWTQRALEQAKRYNWDDLARQLLDVYRSV